MTADLELPASAEDAPPFIDDLDDAIVTGRLLDDDGMPDEWVQYVPANVGQAEDVARRLSVVARREAEVEQQYAVWRARIDGWRADELKRTRPAVELFTRWLEAFGLRERALRPKRATIPLPSAELRTTQKKEPVVVLVGDREDELLAWAREALTSEQYEQVVKTTEHVLISELRKVVAIDTTETSMTVDGTDEPIVEYRVVMPATGAIVPGVTVDAPSTTAKVVLTQ